MKVLESIKVWNYGKDVLGLDLKEGLISEKQDKLIASNFEVKVEFGGELESAWHNGICVAICEIYEGECKFMSGDKYEEFVSILLEDGLTR